MTLLIVGSEREQRRDSVEGLQLAPVVRVAGEEVSDSPSFGGPLMGAKRATIWVTVSACCQDMSLAPALDAGPWAGTARGTALVPLVDLDGPLEWRGQGCETSCEVVDEVLPSRPDG